MARSPLTSRVQSLTFRKDVGWTPSRARAWASEHGYAANKVDEKANTIRLRQFTPRAGDQYATQPFGTDTGILATLAWPTLMVAGEEFGWYSVCYGQRCLEYDGVKGDDMDEFGGNLGTGAIGYTPSAFGDDDAIEAFENEYGDEFGYDSSGDTGIPRGRTASGRYPYKFVMYFTNRKPFSGHRFYRNKDEAKVDLLRLADREFLNEDGFTRVDVERMYKNETSHNAVVGGSDGFGGGKSLVNRIVDMLNTKRGKATARILNSYDIEHGVAQHRKAVSAAKKIKDAKVVTRLRGGFVSNSYRNLAAADYVDLYTRGSKTTFQAGRGHTQQRTYGVGPRGITRIIKPGQSQGTIAASFGYALPSDGMGEFGGDE